VVTFPPAAPTPITADTPFRATGPVSDDDWHEEMELAGDHLGDSTAQSCYEAAGPMSALILHLGEWESSLGLNMVAPGNWLGLRIPGSLAFQSFASPVECVKELMRRWTDPTYKNGVYMPADLSLAEMYTRYAPPNENPTARRIADAVSDINRWRGGAVTPGYNWGPHPFPRDYERRTLPLPPNGQGWDNLGNRSAGMCATFFHHTAGRDNRESVFDLFSPGGGRFGQAMTEGVIDRTGKGIEMLDPWSAIGKEGSIVTPWASGPATSLKGPGIPFVQQLGANAVNKRSYAVEHCNVSGQGFTDAQMDMSAKVYAVVISREKIPWDVWPRNPNVNGLYVAMQHRDVAPTSCPGSDWTRGAHEAWVAAVGLEAKALQGGGGTLPPPPPLPTWPVGYTREAVAGFWAAQGGLKRRMPDGTITVYPFDEKGPISAMWLQRARETGYFPAALHWQGDQTGWNFVTFGDADDTDWILGIGSLESRADWRWLDVAP